MECCNSMGKWGTYNYDFGKAFVDKGAVAVSGFMNTVLSDYSREFTMAYVDQLLAGQDVDHAFDCALRTVAQSDRAWYGAAAYDRHEMLSKKGIAVPVVYGSLKATVRGSRS